MYERYKCIQLATQIEKIDQKINKKCEMYIMYFKLENGK